VILVSLRASAHRGIPIPDPPQAFFGACTKGYRRRVSFAGTPDAAVPYRGMPGYRLGRGEWRHQSPHFCSAF
jgi:hypothetical protein